MTKGFWAVADQGLFAGSNFVLNVLLARWLAPSDYGAFALMFAIFLLVGCLHTAMLTEPMLVFGPGRYEGRLSEYLGSLVYGHVAFAVASGFLLLVSSLVLALLGFGSLAAVLVALALAGPFILFLWLMRRACYARLEPHLAASGGALYMALMLAGAYALYRGEWLSSATSLGVMGISSLAVSLWLMARLRVKPPSLKDELTRDSFGNHLRYGRWSVANEALNWVPMNIFYLVLPIWGGLAAAGAYKALMNPIMPMLQGVWALSVLLLPTLVRARANGDAAFGSRVRLALIPFALGPALYWLLLGLFHAPIVAWLYGGQYTQYSGLLWLLGLSPIAAAAKQVMGHSLRALERPDRLFWAYTLSAVVTLTLGTGLMYLWGVAGAGVGLLISQGITAAVAFVFYRRLKRAASGKEAPSPLGAPVGAEGGRA